MSLNKIERLLYAVCSSKYYTVSIVKYILCIK